MQEKVGLIRLGFIHHVEQSLAEAQQRAAMLISRWSGRTSNGTVECHAARNREAYHFDACSAIMSPYWEIHVLCAVDNNFDVHVLEALQVCCYTTATLPEAGAIDG